jgi:hypothetical protein
MLQEIADYYSRGSIDDLVKERSFVRLLNGIAQASEFIDIHRGLRRVPRSEELAARLRDFVGSTPMLLDETTENSRARNIGFELSIAATAARGGLPVELVAPADLSIQTSARSFFVECKRPFRERKVPNRIRGGLKQLASRYDTAPDPHTARGFLAVSISRLVNDGSLILRVPKAAAVDPEAARVVDRFIARYERFWRACDKRTVAVLIHPQTPCHIQDLSLLVVAHFFTFKMIAELASAEGRDFEPIAQAFGSLERG